MGGLRFAHLFLRCSHKNIWRYRAIARQPRQVDLVNDNIRASRVLLIHDGKQEEMSTREAQQRADEMNQDLVLVQANAQPPVAKIMDWGKAKFEAQKRQKEQRKNQKIVQVKEVRMSPVIDSGDFETRKKAAIRFLEKGNKVKLNLRFRGRMITHQDIGREVLERMANELDDIAKVEQRAKMDGRQMFLVLAPKKG
ncbi:translation initiation factor IF-3 [Fructobacillus sp. M158]|uniref:translation initiation factor IF-3 n=1 Tax=Fructobacillus parabroussonetiae TaxID=2713174 RepID=UPI00200B8D73|nr:translation initiation factor IF-3 [Fructobacillus parabroussonetiae]MCK8616878.1 translation initiation factor IF-3 [Fructobacillus parabroussonetiae]